MSILEPSIAEVTSTRAAKLSILATPSDANVVMWVVSNLLSVVRWSVVIVVAIEVITFVKSAVGSIALLPTRLASAAFENTSTKLTKVFNWVARVAVSPES